MVLELLNIPSLKVYTRKKGGAMAGENNNAQNSDVPPLTEAANLYGVEGAWAIKMALCAKEKLGFIDGRLVEPVV
ncbi:hypothetical protein LIER_32128 [Lithospermum erythrorhizon]|uniref:Uncharacterized protein n=1 Tax=Lithospermum erythrorhizon TaxID=34254 RepID=A0AAV3RVE9_LITER